MALFKSGNILPNIIHVTSQLLTNLNVQVTQTSIQETIENHPDYPSLLSISDSLGVWGIVSKCFKVNSEKFVMLPVPFITNIASNGGAFVTVTALSDSSVMYSHPFENENIITETIEAFLKKWNEVVLVVESVNVKKEKDYEQKRRNEQLRALTLPFILLSCALLLLLFVAASVQSVAYNPILTSGLAITLFSGCIITAILLFYEIDKSNPFIQQICSAAGKTNCTAVLESKGAKVFNWLSWSEIGFFYFTGNFFFLLTGGGDTTVLLLISILNAAALPYTFFSVYYQWKIVKEWCPLCLAVQALFVIEFVLCYFLIWNEISSLNFSFSFHLAIVFFAAFLIPLLFWSYSKKYFLQAKSGERFKNELNRLKYNYSFFETLLAHQRQAGETPDTLGIILGSLDGATRIIKVCNPYCAPCAKAHVMVDELLEKNSNLAVQIIFNATNNEGDARNEPVKHLLSIYKNNNAEYFRKALDDWYLNEEKEYALFAKKYPLQDALANYDADVIKMRDWCEENKIEFTPTFFINGSQLPAIYAPTDLPFFLSGD